MKIITLIPLIIILISCSRPQGSQANDIEDIGSMTARNDGRFDVICLDGSTEIATARQIRSGEVCTGEHPPQAGKICLARDNDGRAPWIIGEFIEGQVVRYQNLIFDEIEQCRRAVSFALKHREMTWLCSSKDRDGRNPWILYRLHEGSATPQGNVYYSNFDNCTSATQKSKRSADSFLLCASRDQDGRNPWNIYQLTPTSSQRTELSYNTFASCNEALANTPDESGLLCVARDDDSRAPWVVARFIDTTAQKILALEYDEIEHCRTALNSLLGESDINWLCSSRDNDGRNPWAGYKIDGMTASKIANLIYESLDQCSEGFRKSSVSGSKFLLCASRDADGRNPWNLFNLDESGAENTSLSYRSFAECLAALGH
jgi:hypothetical protein